MTLTSTDPVKQNDVTQSHDYGAQNCCSHAEPAGIR
jgi:hypothetical protein